VEPDFCGENQATGTKQDKSELSSTLKREIKVSYMGIFFYSDVF
jgi:hypothetical protein